MTFKVVIYRLQLFKQSETFIASQARALSSVDPLLVGRKLFGPPDPMLKHWVPQAMGGYQLARFLATGLPDAFERGVSDHRPDVIHAHFSIDGLYALGLARKVDVPLITTLHGFDVNMSNSALARSGRPALIRYALLKHQLQRGGAHFICVSKFIMDAALRAGFPEKRLSLHYIGVDLEKFQPAKPDSSPRLVHVARLVEKKGTRYLLQAMLTVARQAADIVLDIVGDGPLRQSLEAQAHALGLSEKVRFLGARPHDEVVKIISGATALIVPSVTAANGDAEGLAIVLLEAAASGVPVVVTRHGGMPEAVKHGETGYLVPERDTYSLVEAILDLVHNAPCRERMGTAARQFVQERFDIKKQARSLESLYRRVC